LSTPLRLPRDRDGRDPDLEVISGLHTHSARLVWHDGVLLNLPPGGGPSKLRTSTHTPAPAGSKFSPQHNTALAPPSLQSTVRAGEHHLLTSSGRRLGPPCSPAIRIRRRCEKPTGSRRPRSTRRRLVFGGQPAGRGPDLPRGVTRAADPAGSGPASRSTPVYPATPTPRPLPVPTMDYNRRRPR